MFSVFIISVYILLDQMIQEDVQLEKTADKWSLISRSAKLTVIRKGEISQSTQDWYDLMPNHSL